VGPGGIGEFAGICASQVNGISKKHRVIKWARVFMMPP
jgi:hypothetical protein